ncbi:hypothetical protein ACVITL_006733 [Rhizobium pisi]
MFTRIIRDEDSNAAWVAVRDHVSREATVFADEHGSYNDLAGMNNDLAGFWNAGIRPRHLPLKLEGGLDGVDRAGEFEQHPVAHQFDNAPSMGAQHWIEHMPSSLRQCLECPNLVGFHHSRITDHIRDMIGEGSDIYGEVVNIAARFLRIGINIGDVPQACCADALRPKNSTTRLALLTVETCSESVPNSSSARMIWSGI